VRTSKNGPCSLLHASIGVNVHSYCNEHYQRVNTLLTLQLYTNVVVRREDCWLIVAAV
jgi:hypothetical protein